MQGMRTSTLVALVVVSGIACSDVTGPASPGPITELPRELSAIESELIAGSNAFAFDLAGELLPSGPEENLFFSPLSASMMLGMLLNGADGDTYTEMRDVLGLANLAEPEINQGYADLTDLLLGLDPSVTTAIGNSVWADAGFPVAPDFLDRVSTHFDAEAAEVDLQSPAALDRINAWARDATDGRIDPMFQQLPGNAVMVLLNAIYFKANWTERFDRGDTERAPFTRPDGSVVTVDLMNIETKVPVASDEDVSIVDLPYGGGAFAMTLVVPHAGTHVNDVVAELTAERWSTWTAGLRDVDAHVYLPRMEIEWGARLNDMLIALGMDDAFGPGVADFGRLTPGGGVWLGLVEQKAYVRVDEEGTEAAAVTGGTVFDSGPATVRADRPFLFVLRERLTGTVLFVGVVNDPTA